MLLEQAGYVLLAAKVVREGLHRGGLEVQALGTEGWDIGLIGGLAEAQ